VNAPDFMGQWLLSTNNVCSTLLPEQSPFWTEFSGDWMAAQIAGSSQ
jgi:hypothetical protein